MDKLSHDSKPVTAVFQGILTTQQHDSEVAFVGKGETFGIKANQ